MIACVDPGIRGSGLALFDHEKTLFRAGYVVNPFSKGRGLQAVLCMVRALHDFASPYPAIPIVEWPQSYRVGLQKGDQGDLFPLAGVSAGFAAGCAWRDQGRYYLPHEWKGSIDPDTMIERVKSRLTPAEISVIQFPRKSLEHNVWDAIGIGLHHLGRLERKRVIAR